MRPKGALFSQENSCRKHLDDAFDRNWTLMIFIRTWCEYVNCFPGKIPVKSTWGTFGAKLHFRNNYQDLCWVFQVFSRENSSRKHLDDAYNQNWTSIIIIRTWYGYTKCFPGKIPVESTGGPFGAKLHFRNNYQDLCGIPSVFPGKLR
ncbi:hypothetical protein KQX54_015030 [Cotesia glomerata]|uniref:Uncharacterized protein n=1 Tax=Cotesia glomerata TaxID=32391 RepID=A0AAV7J1U1_COTGL|nr:hypothetical protein KQX54_015030 [Cotesia glomerata]